MPEISIDRSSGFIYKDLLGIESAYLSKLKSKHSEKLAKAEVESPEPDAEESMGSLNRKPLLMNNLITPIEISVESFKITSDLNFEPADEKLYKKSILTKDDIIEKGEHYIDYTRKEDGSSLFIPFFDYNKDKQYFQRFLSRAA